MYRQCEVNMRAFFFLTFNPNIATMFFNNIRRNKQAQPKTRKVFYIAIAGPEEAVEYPQTRFFRHAYTKTLYAYFYPVVFKVGAYYDAMAVGGVLYSVTNEIDKHLANAFAIGFYRW